MPPARVAFSWTPRVESTRQARSASRGIAKVRASGSTSHSPGQGRRDHPSATQQSSSASSSTCRNPPGLPLSAPPRCIEAPIEREKSRASGSRVYDPGVGEEEPHPASGSLDEGNDAEAQREQLRTDGAIDSAGRAIDVPLEDEYSDHRKSLTLLFANLNKYSDNEKAHTKLDNLYDSPAMVLLLAECSEAQKEFLEASGAWVGSAIYKGLCAFGKVPLCRYVEISLFWSHEHGERKARQSPFIIVKTVYDTRTVCGECSHKFGLGHLHSVDAKKVSHADQYLLAVKAAIFQHQPLVLAGDFNMLNYHVATHLDGGDRPLRVTMLASHAQYDVIVDHDMPAPMFGPVAQVLPEIKFDSCAIFGIGHFHFIKLAGFARHALAGVSWPHSCEEKTTHFGYPASCYHQTQPPQPVVAEGLFGDCRTLLRELEMQTLSHPTAKTMFQVLQHAPTGRKLFLQLLEKYPKERVRPEVPSPQRYKETWQQEPRGSCEEVLCDSTQMDPHGNIFGRGGHVSLLVKISSQHHVARESLLAGADEADAPALAGAYIRQRGEHGEAERRVKGQKDAFWKKYDIWPHWVRHDGEQRHWLGRHDVIVGNDARGGAWDGLWWRYARQAWIDDDQEDALRQYEQSWKDNNTEDAHVAALAATQEAFEEAQARGESLESMWAAWEHDKQAKTAARQGAGASGKKGCAKGFAAGKKGGAAGKGSDPRSNWQYWQ